MLDKVPQFMRRDSGAASSESRGHFIFCERGPALSDSNDQFSFFDRGAASSVSSAKPRERESEKLEIVAQRKKLETGVGSELSVGHWKIEDAGAAFS